MTLPRHITSEAEISAIEITAPERVINGWSVASLNYFTVNLEPLGILDPPPHTAHSRPGRPREQFWNEKICLNSLCFFPLLIPKNSLEIWPQRKVKAQKLEARQGRQKQEDKLLWWYQVVPSRQNLSLLPWESLQKMKQLSLRRVLGASQRFLLPCELNRVTLLQVHANTRRYSDFSFWDNLFQKIGFDVTALYLSPKKMKVVR